MPEIGGADEQDRLDHDGGDAEYFQDREAFGSDHFIDVVALRGEHQRAAHRAEALHRHRDRNRHATFARRAVSRADQGVDRLVHVGVRHDDHVVLGAAEALHAFSVRRGI